MSEAGGSEEGGGEVRKAACGGCGGAIRGKAVVGKDRLYHDKCFRCVQCTKRIKYHYYGVTKPLVSRLPSRLPGRELESRRRRVQEGGEEGETEDTVYCRPCYGREMNPTCDGCTRTLGGHYYSLEPGSHWHLECLKCAFCRGSFALPEYRDAPLGSGPLHPACWFYALLDARTAVTSLPSPRKDPGAHKAQLRRRLSH